MWKKFGFSHYNPTECLNRNVFSLLVSRNQHTKIYWIFSLNHKKIHKFNERKQKQKRLPVECMIDWCVVVVYLDERKMFEQHLQLSFFSNSSSKRQKRIFCYPIFTWLFFWFVILQKTKKKLLNQKLKLRKKQSSPLNVISQRVNEKQKWIFFSLFFK